MDRDPLIVPAARTARLLEALSLVDLPIVKAENGQMQLRNNDVLVIASIANDGRPLRVEGVRTERALPARCGGAAEQIQLAAVVLPEQEPAGTVPLVEIRLILRTSPVHAVEIEPRRTKVAQVWRNVFFLEAGAGVEGQIVVDQLTEVRLAGGDEIVVLDPISVQLLGELPQMFNDVGSGRRRLPVREIPEQTPVAPICIGLNRSEIVAGAGEGAG